MFTLNNQQQNWQKICTAEDYQHPDFIQVLEQAFQQSPTYHRKQWEFVVIYLNLLKHGKLNNQSVGASFGAGRERLIFDVAREVKALTATDLYVYNTAWATAKVEQGMSCRDFVLEKAPAGFDESVLDVLEMDMRELGFKDQSLDFGYSSCAVEHIGHFDDFVAHLKEVKRVLKDDGVYVMTTEHLFHHETIPVKGNYKFDFDYWLRVFAAADFYPEPVFDANLKKSFLNRPKPELLPLSAHNERMQLFLPSLVITKHGVPYTSSCFVFRKNQQNNSHPVMQANHAEQQAFLQNRIRHQTQVIYGAYQELDPTMNLRQAARIALSDHLEYLTDDPQTPAERMNNPHFAFTDFVYLDRFRFRVSVKMAFDQPTPVKCELTTQQQTRPAERQAVKTEVIQADRHIHLTFDWQAEPDKVYAIALYSDQIGQVKLQDLSIRIRLLKD